MLVGRQRPGDTGLLRDRDDAGRLPAFAPGPHGLIDELVDGHWVFGGQGNPRQAEEESELDHGVVPDRGAAQQLATFGRRDRKDAVPEAVGERTGIKPLERGGGPGKVAGGTSQRSSGPGPRVCTV
ncbi:MAG: hypothetical protein M5U12_11045 [Verrucomicrobia bacterium]|nr:hypothetical protein [Verrucomicrobiota bacterium]